MPKLFATAITFKSETQKLLKPTHRPITTVWTQWYFQHSNEPDNNIHYSKEYDV